ncbi:HU family DNA-binding protein [Ruminococcus sp. YE282]|uniref:HU family DNA-binding protein n=1 Tax=Ruminococcus sp. YE282 TaxID=3158780 RepID=UPI00088DF187|nr:DNA-binding protein HU-beta [Ruminococcus bromii]
MGKNEIVKQLAERIDGNITEETTQKYSEVCDTLVDIFTDALIEEKRILWKGFLSMEVRDRAARKARNPATNQIELFPATKVVRCKVSDTIKNIIAEK